MQTHFKHTSLAKYFLLEELQFWTKISKHILSFIVEDHIGAQANKTESQGLYKLVSANIPGGLVRSASFLVHRSLHSCLYFYKHVFLVRSAS